MIHEENEETKLVMQEIEILLNLASAKIVRLQPHMSTPIEEVNVHLIYPLMSAAIYSEKWNKAHGKTRVPTKDKG
jgi:hypothetical protein